VRIVVAAALWLSFGVVEVAAQGSSGWLARVPSRLAAFNAFRDAAEASLSCGKDEAKIKAAISANQAVLDLYPQSEFADDCLFKNGELWQRLGRTDKAVEALVALAERFPHSDLADEALWLAAKGFRVLRREEDEREALLLLTSNYPLSPHWEEAFVRLAREAPQVLAVREAAVAALSQGRLTPDARVKALMSLALAAKEEGDFAGALELYRQVAAEHPDSSEADDALLQAILLLRRTGEPPWVVSEAVQELLDRYPYSDSAARASNLLLLGKGRRPLPDNSDSGGPAEAVREAKALQVQRRFGEAIEAYKAVLSLYPEGESRDDALFGLASCLAEIGKVEGALREATLPEQVAEAQLELARSGALGAVQATRQAIALFEELLLTCPSSGHVKDALFEIGRCCEALGDKRAAALAYGRFLAYRPTGEELEEAAKALFAYLTSAGEEALEVYAALSAGQPHIFPPAARGRLESVRMVARWYEQVAADAKHRKIPLSPDDFCDDALLLGALTSLEQGEDAAAQAQLQALLDRYPTSGLGPAALFLLARIHQRNGDFATAWRLAARVAEMPSASGLEDDADALCEGFEGVRGTAGLPEIETIAHSNVKTVCTVHDSLRLRQYDLPQMWDQACARLAEWTGIRPAAKPVIIVGGPTEAAGVFARVDGSVLQEPPDWGAGFRPLASAWLELPALRVIGDTWPRLREALALLASCYLQYDLVHETRDVIGAPSASRLPNEAVLRERERLLARFYQEQAEGRAPAEMSAEGMAGLLFFRLAKQGAEGQGIVDWWPLHSFFLQILRLNDNGQESDRETAATLVWRSLEQALGTTLGEHLALAR